MTRQSKNARNRERARQITLLHQEGKKGPSRTVTKHGKHWGYRTNPEVQKRIAELAKVAQAPSSKTSGKRILEKAGGASKDAQ